MKRTILLCVLLTLAACAKVRPFLPIAGNVTGTALCTAAPAKDKQALREIVLPNLLAATPAQRRKLLEDSHGLVALYAPSWFGQAWQSLHDVFRQSTDETVQADYDRAVDGLIAGCAAALGVTA